MSLHVHANGLHNRVYCVYCKPRINNWNYEQTLFSIQTCLFSCAAFQSVYLMQAWVIVGLRTCVCTGRLEKRKDAVVRGTRTKPASLSRAGVESTGVGDGRDWANKGRLCFWTEHVVCDQWSADRESKHSSNSLHNPWPLSQGCRMIGACPSKVLCQVARDCPPSPCKPVSQDSKVNFSSFSAEYTCTVSQNPRNDNTEKQNYAEV